jgi:OOP family OmpA-OmpF porin
MFKQKIYLSTLCAALMGMSFHSLAADEPGFTFGIDYGRTEAKKYCDNIANCDSTDKGPKISVGYDFSKTFGVELGYTSFGTLFDSNNNSVQIQQKSNAITLSIIGTVPIGDYFGLYGRLGYARYDTNNTGTVEGVAVKDERGNTPMWGAGIKFNASEQLAVRLEYQNYSDLSDIPGRKDDVQGLFAGGVYRF